MASTFKKSSKVTIAWLRPGQRFRASDDVAPGMKGELTVARIVQDGMGLSHAVLRDETGREISTYADQIQFAIEVGMLSPIEIAVAGPAC